MSLQLFTLTDDDGTTKIVFIPHPINAVGMLETRLRTAEQQAGEKGLSICSLTRWAKFQGRGDAFDPGVLAGQDATINVLPFDILFVEMQSRVIRMDLELDLRKVKSV